MKKKLVILIALMASLFLVVGSANATLMPTLDFSIKASLLQTGIISYSGSQSPLVGIGIVVDEVVGLNTPSNSGVPLPISGGLLDFTTGASTGTWTWGGSPGSSITMSGTVPGITGSNLLSGSFGTASVYYLSGDFHISGAAFSDVKNQDLLNFYGLPYYAPDGTIQQYMGNFNISFQAPYTTGGANFTSSQVLSGDVTNVVPEPGTMFLLGSALMGLGLVRFRKKFRH